MKITLFTANQNRHNYLVNLLSNNCDELFVVQENRTIFPGIVLGHYPASEIMKKYFGNRKSYSHEFSQECDTRFLKNTDLRIHPNRSFTCAALSCLHNTRHLNKKHK